MFRNWSITKGLLVLVALVVLGLTVNAGCAGGDFPGRAGREAVREEFGVGILDGLRTIGGFGRGYFTGTGMTGGMMGGMMGGYGYQTYYPEEGQIGSLDLASATKRFEEYAARYGNGDLQLAEVMEFSNQFYAELAEKSTGIFAAELILDKYTGRIYPEMGPNTMWNQKYGHMGGSGMMGWGSGRSRVDEPMAVSPDKAIEYAQSYLDRAMPGTIAAEPHAFYGYYTLHTERNGQITGMLSVNGYTGQVWYHDWHGPFISMSETEAAHRD